MVFVASGDDAAKTFNEKKKKKQECLPIKDLEIYISLSLI